MQHNVQHDRSPAQRAAYARLKAELITPEDYSRIYRAAEPMPGVCDDHPWLSALIIDAERGWCAHCAMGRLLEAKR